MTVFDNDPILPAQWPPFSSRRRHATPHHQLLWAMLDEAWRCLQYVDRRRSEARSSQKRLILYRDARAWFLMENDSMPFSFENVAAWLGIDAAAIKREVMRRFPVTPLHLPPARRARHAAQRPSRAQRTHPTVRAHGENAQQRVAADE